MKTCATRLGTGRLSPGLAVRSPSQVLSLTIGSSCLGAQLRLSRGPRLFELAQPILSSTGVSATRLALVLGLSGLSGSKRLGLP